MATGSARRSSASSLGEAAAEEAATASRGFFFFSNESDGIGLRQEERSESGHQFEFFSFAPTLSSRRAERRSGALYSPPSSPRTRARSGRYPLCAATAVMVITREREERQKTTLSLAAIDHRISPSSFASSLLSQKTKEHLQQPGPHAGRDHPARPEPSVGWQPQAEGRGQAPEQFELRFELIGRRQQ